MNRKEKDKAVRDYLEQTVLQHLTAGVMIVDARTHIIENVNPAAATLFGAPADQIVGRQCHDFVCPAGEGVCPVIDLNQDLDNSFRVLVRADRSSLPILKSVKKIQLGGKEKLLEVFLEMSEFKKTEEALRESEERYRTIFESFVDIYYQTDLNCTITELSPSVFPLTGWRPEELVGTQVLDVYHDPAERTRLLQELAQKHAVNGFEMLLKKKDGTPTPASVNARMLKNSAGEPTGISGTIRDITERKNAELRIESQLQHLRALNAIDLAIASTFDLRVTFSVLLERVVTQLRADAAAVLLFDPYSNRFECAAQRGFRNSAVVNSTFRLGDDLISTVVRDRRGAGIADGTKTDHPFIPSELAAGEDFVGVQATPLIAKGKVNGALVVFRRSLMSPGPEWFDFYRTVADQTAVAIDNARLFDDLQSANLELIQAYDATIEGWSAALDLRDKETEGHSQRVTQMTVDIARTMGIRHVDLVHIRRGALLHDIGKMGVPDAILLKADPLTDEEWTIMRRHPEFAYQLLSPIPYLQPALDIPYCHHERWDGSGYPRGLKGKAIPVAARIFSVVDAWDALRSDRPYRAAWPAEQAREHIRKLAGTHFDPDIVRLFLGIVGHDTASL